MLDALYSDTLLAAAGSLPARAPLPDLPGRARRASRVCGSEVELVLTLTDGVVDQVFVDARACALGQAAAGLFLPALQGATPVEVRAALDLVRAMLKDGAAPPDAGRWAGLAPLAAIKDYPARHASTLLVFEAAVAALEALGA
jgi:NifU-like protein involved in Fe-S cluster formation